MDKFDGCLQLLSNLDHNKFIQDVYLNDSDNLEILMKLLAYFRTQVIPVYGDISEKIVANSIVLCEKEKYVIEDFEKLNSSTEEVILKFKYLFEKYTAVKEKQLELLDRAENVVFEVQKRHKILSDEELHFIETLEKLSKKATEYQESIDVVRKKKSAIQNHEDQWDNISKKYFLNERHLEIIRESLGIIALGIREVLNTIATVGRKLNEGGVVVHQDCS